MAYVLLSLMILASVYCEITHNRNQETELIDYLLTGYNRQARPVKNISEPVHVFIAPFIGKLLDLDGSSEILTTYMWFDVHWTDELLQWNVSEFGGIESVTLLPTQVWLPDFGVINSAEKIFFEDHMRYFRVSLHSNGNMRWHPGGIYRTTCSLKVTYFPFDTQVCQLIMGNWEYDGHEQYLHLGSSGVTPDMAYTENGEWRLANSCGFAHIIQGPEPLPHLTFLMVFERKAKYTVINVIIPIILLSIMDLLVFWLPPESGEKVSLGITVLLSFSVFLLVVEERLPRTSENMPILTIYLSLIMGTTGLSLLVTVIMLHLHHKAHDSPVPRWLCRILCLNFNEKKGLQRRETTEIIDDGVKFVKTESSLSNGQPSLSNGTVCQSNGHPNWKDSRPEHRLKHDKKELTQSKMESQWKLATRKIDQLCFVLFFIIFGTLALIIVYPYYRAASLNNLQCEKV